MHELVEKGGGTAQQQEQQQEQLRQCTQDFSLLSERLTDLASMQGEVRDSVQQVLDKAAAIQQLIERQTAAIMAVDHKVASVGSAVQEVKHLVKDVHHSIAEQRQQKQDEKLAEAAVLQALVRDHLHRTYTSDDKIVSVFGPAMELDGDFINLQILHHVKLKKTDKDDSDPAAKSGKEHKAPVHVSSYDDLFGDKRALVLADLFTPNSKLFKEDKLDQKDAALDAVPPQFVLVQGRAGIGKTTLVRHVVREWAQRRVLHDSFEWVFLLRLRELSSPTFLGHKSITLVQESARGQRRDQSRFLSTGLGAEHRPDQKTRAVPAGRIRRAAAAALLRDDIQLHGPVLVHVAHHESSTGERHAAVQAPQPRDSGIHRR